MSMTPEMLEVIERDKDLWVPEWLEGDPNPPDHENDVEDKHVHVNVVPGEIEVADHDLLQREIEKYGRIEEEPEIARARELGIHLPEPVTTADVAREVGIEGYAGTYWTHFDYRPDVARNVARVQKQFPWLTFMNTYFRHPPVYRRKYEFVSRDTWQGGISNGRYTGYRGKPLDPSLGVKVFNAIFYDPYTPPIYWIIYRGRQWVRGYGWGPAPWGPPGSDPNHDWHIHDTSLLVY
jgi:hypothetical protein